MRIFPAFGLDLGKASQLWGLIQDWAKAHGKGWHTIGNFNCKILRGQRGRKLVGRLPELVMVDTSSIGALPREGCFLVVPAGTNHCIAVDRSIGIDICGDPACAEKCGIDTTQSVWRDAVLPGWTGAIRKCYQMCQAQRDVSAPRARRCLINAPLPLA